jgi:hypothetical protein
VAISIPIIAEFTGDGIAKARKEFAQLEGAGKKAQFAIRKAAIPAAAALSAVGAALFDATKGAMEDAAAQDLLANNLRKTTKATDAQIAANEDWISTQGQLLGVADDQLRPALAKLARATGDVTQAQKLATQAMDIAAATGKPLETVVSALEKAYGGNMTALSRLAPEYRQLIKDGASFEEVMAKLAATTGGAATEAANTAAGRMKRLSLAVDETKESIGAALLPAVEAALPKLQSLAMWAQKNPEAFTKVAGAIAAIAAATLAVNAAMAINPYVLMAAGVVAIAVAFDRLAKAAEKINKVGGVALRLIGALARIPQMGILDKFIFNSLKPDNSPSFGGLSDSRITALSAGSMVSGSAMSATSAGGGDTNVQIHVNGGDPQQVVEALRRYMQVNGSVPIRVAF